MTTVPRPLTHSTLEATTAPAGQSPGAMLAEARRRRGLSIADLARRMRLQPRQIEALEADDFARLPGATFVRGALRGYARLLDLDPEPLLALQQRLAPGAAPALRVPSDDIRLRPCGVLPGWIRVALGGLALVVAVAAAWYAFPPGGVPAGPLAGRPHGGEPPAAPAPAAAPSVPHEAAPPSAPPPAAPVASVPSEAPPSAASVPVEAPPGQPRVARLRFAFSGESWVEVRDAGGQVILRQLSPAASEKAVEGVPPFRVVVGNAAATRVSLDDQPVTLVSASRDNVARMTIQ